jgi:hypothetical protein
LGLGSFSIRHRRPERSLSPRGTIHVRRHFRQSWSLEREEYFIA